MPQQIESAVQVDIRQKRNASFEWIHEEFNAQDEPDDLTGRTYQMIIDEGLASEIVIDGDLWITTEGIVTYTKDVTAMSALTVWDHTYLCKYEQGAEISNPYCYWTLTIF